MGINKELVYIHNYNIVYNSHYTQDLILKPPYTGVPYKDQYN